MSGLGYIDPRTVDLEGLAADFEGADDATLEGLGGFDEEAMTEQQIQGILEQNPDWDTAEGVGFLKKLLKNNKNTLKKIGGAIAAPILGGVPIVGGLLSSAVSQAANGPIQRAAPAPVAIVQQPGPVAPPPPPPAPKAEEDKLKKYAPWAIGGGILLVGLIALSRRGGDK